MSPEKLRSVIWICTHSIHREPKHNNVLAKWAVVMWRFLLSSFPLFSVSHCVVSWAGLLKYGVKSVTAVISVSQPAVRPSAGKHWNRTIFLAMPQLFSIYSTDYHTWWLTVRCKNTVDISAVTRCFVCCFVSLCGCQSAFTPLGSSCRPAPESFLSCGLVYTSANQCRSREIPGNSNGPVLFMLAHWLTDLSLPVTRGLPSSSGSTWL